MAVCEFNKLKCVPRGKDIGVWLWFEAPNMHMMFNLTFTLNWHDGCA